MDIISIAISVISVVIAGISLRKADRANRRTSSYADAVFKTVRHQSNDGYSAFLLRNVGSSPARQVRAELFNRYGTEVIAYNGSEFTHDYEVVAVGEDVWLSSPLGEAGRRAAWERGLNELRVHWETMAGEDRSEVLSIPVVQHNEGLSFSSSDEGRETPEQ